MHLPELSVSDEASLAPDEYFAQARTDSETLDNQEGMPPAHVTVEIVPSERHSDHLPTYPKFYERRKKSSSTKEKTDLPEVQSQGEEGLLQDGGVPPLAEEVDVGWPIALRKGTQSCTKPKSPQHKHFF